MNRKKLLALAKANGYTGAEDLAAVKTYLAEKGIELQDTDGKALDLAAVWAKEGKVIVADATDPGDTDPTQQDTVTIKTAELDSLKKQAKAGVEANRGKGREKIALANEGRVAIHSDLARKHYAAKIAAGKAVFPDVDAAELCGALMRLSIAKFNGDIEYTQKGTDLDVIGKTGLTTTATAVGVLIPSEYVPTILYLTEKYGVARKIANVVPMLRDTKEQPRKTSIISMSHVGEAAASTAQDNAYDMVTLVAKKVQATSQISNEALEDAAVSVADDLAASFAEAYAKRMDQDYFLGDGTSTYGGHVGLANALPSGAYFNGSGNAWSAITAADFYTAIGYLENVDPNRIGIICSRQFYFTRLRALETATSQFKQLVGGPVGGSDASFDGWPVFWSQVLPTTSASASKIAYIGDFQAGSMIGERRDLSIAQSEHVAFTSDVMTYRANARFAVNVHGDGRGSTYGPIVCLKTS